MSTEEGGEERRRRREGEFCGFATGPLIKMHKLSKCGEFDELSSLATLDAKCGQSMDRGRKGVGFHFVCKAFLITLLEQRRRHFTERGREREGSERRSERKEEKKNRWPPKHSASQTNAKMADIFVNF